MHVETCLEVRYSRVSLTQHSLMKRIRHRISLVVAVNVALVAFVVNTCLKCVDSYHHPVYDGKIEERDEMLLPIVYICTVEEEKLSQVLC